MKSLFIASALVLPVAASAQNSIWETGKSSKKNAKEKLTKTGGRVKKFKNHLENWGLSEDYNHALLVGGKLNSDGWSGCMNIVKRTSKTTNSFLQICFSEVKHEKQAKQDGKKLPQFGPSSPYVYGKINNLYTLQVGIGQEKVLLPSVMEGNISVSLRYDAGFSLAMLKPYYLKLRYNANTGKDSSYMEIHKYSRPDSAQFLNNNAVIGSAGWSKGLDEINYLPGGYAELALAITPGKTKTFAQLITLGISISAYPQPLVIMADQKAYYWQGCLFAGLMIGKRWK